MRRRRPTNSAHSKPEMLERFAQHATDIATEPQDRESQRRRCRNSVGAHLIQPTEGFAQVVLRLMVPVPTAAPACIGLPAKKMEHSRHAHEDADTTLIHLVSSCTLQLANRSARLEGCSKATTGSPL